MTSTRTPAIRIGDVIMVPSGADPAYRQAYRLRVTEISNSPRLGYAILGGIVVNANGADRMRNGRPVERAFDLVDRARDLVIVLVPAPATGQELLAAYAMHAAWTREASRCDHTADQAGCAHVDCEGVPPVDGAIEPRPVPTTRGVDMDGPASLAYLVRQWVGYATPAEVTLSASKAALGYFEARGEREFYVITVTVLATGVQYSVITDYRACRAMRTHVVTDGAPISGNLSEHACMLDVLARRVARVIEDHVTASGVEARAVDPMCMCVGVRCTGECKRSTDVSDAGDQVDVASVGPVHSAPVDVVTFTRSLKFGDRVSGMTADRKGFAGYLTRDAFASGPDGAGFDLSGSAPLPGKSAFFRITPGARVNVLPVDADGIRTACLAVEARTVLDPADSDRVRAWLAGHGVIVADPYAPGQYGKRSPVRETTPDRPGNGTARRWGRVINGRPYSFTAVLMPDGERRYTVSRYNGYGADAQGRPSRVDLKFGCAWTPVHSITIRPDAGGAPGTDAPTGDSGPTGATPDADPVTPGVDGSALYAAYTAACEAASVADGPAPRREDMRPRTEIFRGRRLRTVRGQKWGTIDTFVNGRFVGQTTGTGPAALNKAAEQLRRDVIGADERRIIDPHAYDADWYTGAPEPCPVVAAYVRHRADQEAADRAAIASPDQPDTDQGETMSDATAPTVPADVPVVDVAPSVLAALIAGAGVDQPADDTPAPAPEMPARLSVSVDRAVLLAALTVAGKMIPKRVPVPVLCGVLISADTDGVTVSAFDYEIGFSARLDASVTGTGRVLVAASALLALVKSLPKPGRLRKGETRPADADRVHLVDAGAALSVTHGGVSASLDTMPVEDYPTLPAMPDRVVARIDAGVLAAGVARVATALGTDAVLPAITGVEVTTLADGSAMRMVTTDRYRAAFDELPWTPTVGGEHAREHIAAALIPGQTLALIASTLGKIGGTVEYGQFAPGSTVGMVGFRCGGWTFTTRTLDGLRAFPEVRIILDAHRSEGRFTVDAGTLAETVKRAATRCDGKADPVRLVFDADGITVCVGSPGARKASEHVPCEHTVTPGTEIGFNPVYLRAALDTFGGNVVGSVEAARKPVVFRTVDSSPYVHLVNPVRLSDTDTVPATPASPATPAPAPAPAPEETTVDTTSTDTPAAPVTIGVVEMHAQAAYTAMKAGDYVTALEKLDDAETGAPAGYLVAGRHPFDVVRAAIVAARDAATPAAPVDVSAPADTPAAPDTADQVAAPVDVDAWETLAMATWTVGTLPVKGQRTGHTVDVLKLPAGSIPRDQYLAIKAVVSSLRGAWHKAVRGFAFELPSRVWPTGELTESGRDRLNAWLAANDPARTGGAATETPAAPAETAAETTDAPAAPDGVETPTVPATDAVTVPGVGSYVRVYGTNGNGEPLTVEGYVTRGPVPVGDRARVRIGDTPSGRGRMVYVTSTTRVDVLDTPAPAASADQVAAPVAVPTLPADLSALDPAARTALVDAYTAALAALTGTPAPVPAPSVDQVDTADQVDADAVREARDQDAIAAAVRKLPPSTLGFTIPEWKITGVTYGEVRTMVRAALKSAGIRATVEKPADGGKRDLRVTVHEGTNTAALAVVGSTLDGLVPASVDA